MTPRFLSCITVRIMGKWAKRKMWVSRTEAGFGHAAGEVLRSGFDKYIETGK